MESDTEKTIALRDSEIIIWGDHPQGSNVAAVLNSGGSAVKINSLSIDLGIIKEKGDPQKCSHFSIRGYVAKMRERGGNNYSPFADGSVQELPPIEVPSFRYWLCQSCLQDYGGGSTSQEVALVSQYGKSMMQPCRNSYSTQDCHGLRILPFGEGTSGHKPVDERNGDESSLTVLQEDTTPADIAQEPAKIDPIVAEEATVLEDDDLRDADGSKKLGIVNGPSTCPAVPSIESDQNDDDPCEHPRRKTRKVRLLTELLCRSNEKQHHRKESNLCDSTPTPLTKRKMPQADVITQGHVSKKVKVTKGDATVKTNMVEGGQKTDKYECKKHGNQKSSKLGKVSDPVTAWRSIFSDMGRPDRDKLVSVGADASRLNHDVSEGRGIDSFFEERSNACINIPENPPRSQLSGEDIQRTNVGGSRVRGRQSETGLGLGLSLNYDQQFRGSWLPPLPNRVPTQDHGSKDGFFFGESSIAHKGVISDRQANSRLVYNVRDGYTPRTAFLQEQQPYHAPLSHGSFSQRQNLDFSDPHNKRNNGVRGYQDVMRTHNHQRQEIFSNGRSDETEIIELMAKIQHERNLGEARNYNGITNTSNIQNFSSFNQGTQIPLHQYPTIRRPSSSTMPTMENSCPTTMRNPSGFFHQESVPPAFPNFSTFSLNGMRGFDNSHYHESSENHRIPGNVWSNMEMHTKWSNKNKGKNIMNLDLNVMAPNVLEEQNHTSLDPSYSNEAIPAMQLLSLMDAGKKSNSSPFMDKKKLNQKPFSCYNNITGNPYSGLQSSVQKPIENSRNFNFSHGSSSPSLPVTHSFSSFFHTNQTTDQTRRQFFHKPEDSFGFPVPWHASEGGLGSRNVTPRTDICTVNRNPADFSTPEPENVYMIDVENLKFRGDNRVFYPREGTV